MTTLDTRHSAHSPFVPVGGRAVGPSRAEVVVAIVDPAGHAHDVITFLPRRWVTCRYQTIYDVADRPDLLVLGSATPPLVAASRLLHPHAMIVGLIDGTAPARLIVDIL